MQNTTPIFVDTCALAHPITRIAYRNGTLQNAVVLQSVLLEIQRLAAHDNPEKQGAGHQAALTLVHLQSMPAITVAVDTQAPCSHHTDDDLLERTRKAGGCLLTNDRELQDRARSEGIEVISIQQLQQQSHHDLAAGDVVTVRINNPGTKAGQGTGLLPDGRKVVVNGGTSFLGQTITVQIIRLLRVAHDLELLFANPAPQMVA